MRYRRDIHRGDQDLLRLTVAHVVEHLLGAADPYDDPSRSKHLVNMQVIDHVDGDPEVVSVIGALDVAPCAPYLEPDFDPSLDYPFITFLPYEEAGNDRFADKPAFLTWRDENPR
jgi:hypothetical protein